MNEFIRLTRPNGTPVHVRWQMIITVVTFSPYSILAFTNRQTLRVLESKATIQKLIREAKAHVVKTD